MAQETGPKLTFIRDEIDHAIDAIRAKQREFAGEEDVKKALDAAIAALRATEDKIQKDWCFPTWFFMR